MPAVNDKQNVRVLNFAFDTYFPIWIEEAYGLLLKKNRNNMAERIARKGYYDPDVLGEIMPDELEEIQKKVGQRLNKGSGTYRVANGRLDIGVFIEALGYVTKLDASGNVDRLYKKADRSRIAKVGSHWIWDEFSKQDAETNLRTVFDNLPDAYAQIVRNNFPTLKEELDLFEQANAIYVSADIKDTYTDFTSGPTYRMYYVHESGRKKRSIEFIDETSAQKYEELVWSKEKRANAPYQLISANHSSLDFLYSDTPLLDLIYNILTTRLKNYFQSA